MPRLTAALCHMAPSMLWRTTGSSPLQGQQWSVSYDSATPSRRLGASRRWASHSRSGGHTRARTPGGGTLVCHRTASLSWPPLGPREALVCSLVQRCLGMQAPKDHGIITLKLEGPGKLSSLAPNSDLDSKARESKDPCKSHRPHWSRDWERDLGCPTTHPSEAPWSSKRTFHHLSDQVAVWSGDLRQIDVTYPLD